MTESYPRIMIAGTSGDSGKTIFTLALLSAWRLEGISLRAFKKGPDFIDAAWLGWAAGSPVRNLDTYMMGFEVVARSFAEHAISEGLNLIEGNRGLLDGVDSEGTHSSAALAETLACPVVLVVSPTKVTATTAATVLGCRQLAPDLDLRGVVLNQVAGERHARVVRQAIEQHTGVPVLGALPKISGQLLPSRHLGLVPPAEQEPAEALRDIMAKAVRENCDLDRLLDIARSARPLPSALPEPVANASLEITDKKVRIGFFYDSAFTFYYPENLEALQEGGAELVAVSALADKQLPPLDALYIGGGFPETHTEKLSENHDLQGAVQHAATAGLPIYAECGGLMYLAESLEWEGNHVPMAGVLPIRVRVHDRPQGRGYCRMVVDRPNPFFPEGTVLVGHEFHYSFLTGGAAGVTTAYRVEKGRGCVAQRDGIVHGSTLASYLHLHALGCPEWARGLIRAAVAFRDGQGRATGGGAVLRASIGHAT
jgi:cobyrinic acid a,c-diamide synthase